MSNTLIFILFFTGIVVASAVLAYHAVEDDIKRERDVRELLKELKELRKLINE